jgi:hypothetical protein
MSDRGNSMGPHVGNRPPCVVLAANDDGAARPDCRRAHRLPAGWNESEGQEVEQNVGSVADHEGRDRFDPGQDPTQRMIRPWRKDKMISA